MIRKGYIGFIAVLVLVLAPWSLAQNKESKTGYLALTAPAQVGSVVLPAGNYEVTHRFSPTGHFTEFARITEWNLGYEGSPTYRERKVVANVDCTMQPLSAKVGKTVIEKDGSRIARLEIKGESVAHNF